MGEQGRQTVGGTSARQHIRSGEDEERGGDRPPLRQPLDEKGKGMGRSATWAPEDEPILMRLTPWRVTFPPVVTVVSGKPVPAQGLPGEVEKSASSSASERAPSWSW